MRYFIGKLLEALDRAIARLVHWSDKVFKEKHPFSLLGRVMDLLTKKIGLASTEAQLALRRKERRNDPTIMSPILIKCIRGQRWRRAILVVKFADQKSQRILLDRFIEEGKMYEAILVVSATGITPTEEDVGLLTVRASLFCDQDRLPLNGRRALATDWPRPDLSHEDMVKRLAQEMHNNSQVIRYN